MRIDITGNGGEWFDADHRLYDAMVAAGADEDVYDQEPDGSCHTFLTIPEVTDRLRELIELAPHAQYD